MSITLHSPSDRKFDGWHYRRLTPAEFGQIAGRAGRNMRDGTFGTTGRCPPFDPELVSALEEHRFDPVSMLQWRNTDLDFASMSSLAASLDVMPKEQGLTRAPLAEDQMVLEIAARDEKVRRETKTAADVARLWDCCQIPDYRKLSPAPMPSSFCRSMDSWYGQDISRKTGSPGI